MKRAPITKRDGEESAITVLRELLETNRGRFSPVRSGLLLDKRIREATAWPRPARLGFT